LEDVDERLNDFDEDPFDASRVERKWDATMVEIPVELDSNV
jgi:hypothetical protein